MMSRKLLSAAAVVISATLWVVPARAAGSGRMSVDRLADNSDAIIYARVIGNRPYWDSGTQAIWTRTDLQVLDAPKGNPGSLLSIEEPGGILTGRGEIYPGVPQFQVGQEAVLFLYRAPGNRLRVTGMLQGVFLVSADRVTGIRMARPAAPGPESAFEEGSPNAQAARQDAARPEVLGRFLMVLREKGRAR